MPFLPLKNHGRAFASRNKGDLFNFYVNFLFSFNKICLKNVVENRDLKMLVYLVP